MLTDSDFFKVLDSFKELVFILDGEGKIVFKNQFASDSVYIDQDEENFLNYFTDEDKKKATNLFNHIDPQKNTVTDFLQLSINNQKFNSQIAFSSYNIKQQRIVLASILVYEELSIEGKKVKFSVSQEDLNILLNDSVHIRIFERLKSDFPFTLIGKNNFQNEVNKLESFFWIKDQFGKYILVNDKFAQGLGMRPIQIEGRYEKEFLPRFLTDFSDSIMGFIKDTTNIIVREGFPFPNPSGDKNLRVYEIPICDLDNEVMAIVGITQRILDNEGNRIDIKYFVRNIVEHSGFAIAVMDENEKLLFVNSMFKKMLPLENYNENKEISFNSYSALSDELKQFIKAKDQTEKIKKISIPANNFGNTFFDFHFRKIYNEYEELKGFLIRIDEDENEILKRTLTSHRGKMYEIIIQNSPEPMFIYEVENLRFLEVNRAALNLYGYTKNEFLQMDLTDLYAPEDIQTLLNTSETGIEEMKFTGPWRHKKKDGSTVYVEISKSNFDFNGKVAHFNIIKDVTDKVKMQKEIQLYKASFENTSDLVFISDSDGFITYANEIVYNTLGYTGSELDSRPLITMVSDDDRMTISGKIYNEDISSAVKLGASLKKKNGELLDVNLTATPIRDLTKQIISYSIIASPKVAPIKPDAEVIDKPMVSSREKSSKGMDIEFLSNVFHEILTPMNVILGFVQELVENIETPSVEQKESIEIIEQNREVLLQTMNSLLEYSHFEQNKIEVSTRKFLFTDIVETLQKRTQKIAKTRNIEFAYGKISSSLNIETDTQKLETLLIMFITVAMHITREKKIYLSAYQYDDEHFVVSVKDNRKSITAYLSEHLSNIFDSENFKKDFGVSKLTLNLSRKLLELLSGHFEYIKRGEEIIEAGFVFPLAFIPVIEQEIKKEEVTEPESYEEEIISHTVKEQPQTQEKLPVVEEVITENIPEPEVELHTEEEIEPLPVLEVKIGQPVIEEKPEAIPERLPVEKIKGGFDLSKLQCLYVEDQVDSQILFKVQLKEVKKIDFAVSFEAALPLLQNNKYDFIVLDINLQGEYNGLDALRIIRKLPGYESSKIIAVTAYVLPGDKDKFIFAGFNDFISKPILREKLLDSLGKIMVE